MTLKFWWNRGGVAVLNRKPAAFESQTGQDRIKVPDSDHCRTNNELRSYESGQTTIDLFKLKRVCRAEYLTF